MYCGSGSENTRRTLRLWRGVSRSLIQRQVSPYYEGGRASHISSCDKDLRLRKHICVLREDADIFSPLGIEKDQQLGQTPLQLLSQVATGPQRQPTLGEAADAAVTPQQQEWTFNTPLPVDYSKSAPVNSQSTGVGYTTDGMYGNDQNMGLPMGMDPMNGDFGWGSGFEQAMDMALYDTEGLQGSGLDNWFLGDSMAPFAFNGDTAAGAGGGMNMSMPGTGWQ